MEVYFSDRLRSLGRWSTTFLAELFQIAQHGYMLHVTLTMIHTSFLCGEVEMLEKVPGILIADDDSIIRTALSGMLAEIGYQVRTAVDGFSALSEIRREIPDILLSDLHMPRMSGFELLRVVRQRFPAIQVIAMSGSFSGSEVPSGVPADAFFQKGSSMVALLHAFGDLPHIRRRDPVALRTALPLWIQRNGMDSSGRACVRVSCSECLRSFQQILESDGPIIREVRCIHCHCPIRYAIAEPFDHVTPHCSLAAASAVMATEYVYPFSS